jgi:hypothetical protein
MPFLDFDVKRQLRWYHHSTRKLIPLYSSSATREPIKPGYSIELNPIALKAAYKYCWLVYFVVDKTVFKVKVLNPFHKELCNHNGKKFFSLVFREILVRRKLRSQRYCYSWMQSGHTVQTHLKGCHLSKLNIAEYD